MNVKYIKRLFGVITCAIIVGFPVSWIVSDLMTAPNTIANFFAILILILYLLTLAMLLLQYALPASLDDPNLKSDVDIETQFEFRDGRIFESIIVKKPNNDNTESNTEEI